MARTQYLGLDKEYSCKNDPRQMNTLICGYWQCFVCVSEDFTHIAVSNIHYLTVHGIKMILIPKQNNVFLCWSYQ